MVVDRELAECNDDIGCSRSIAEAPKYSDDSDKTDAVVG